MKAPRFVIAVVAAGAIVAACVLPSDESEAPAVPIAIAHPADADRRRCAVPDAHAHADSNPNAAAQAGRGSLAVLDGRLARRRADCGG